MANGKKLHDPWLVAVWPGMGQVAISAGYYLMAKLGMHQLAELAARELFEVEHVEVKGGLISTGRLPRSRFFVHEDPARSHDIVLFIGEAQPPAGKLAFCRRLVEFAQERDVARVFTFAAMGTLMDPDHDSRVFAAATDEASLAEVRSLGLHILEDGHIGGLNGLLLGVAAESGLRGTCLLGEIPQVLSPIPFPKAALAVLRVFATLADLRLDLEELAEQARAMEPQLRDIHARFRGALEQKRPPEEEPYRVIPEPEEEERLSPEDERLIERLFAEAKTNRRPSC